MTKTFVLDLLERAVKTFGQAAGAVLVAQWAGSGLGVDIFDYSAWQKILTAAVAAGLAAVVSLGTSLLSGLKTGTASAVPEVAQTAVVGGTGQIIGAVGRHEAAAVATDGTAIPPAQD